MSSSSNYHSSQLHRLNLHSNGKRPFEECGGYDSDQDSSMNNALQASGSSTSSGDSSRFPTSSSSSTSTGEGRNKRARSTSSSSNSDESSSSDVSRSTGYNTAQSSSRSDLSLDGPSALPRNAVDCPIPPISTPSSFVSQDEDMSDLRLDIRRPVSPPQRASPGTAEDTLRTSLERFSEFDRQIAALRSSLAASRSPLLPPLGSSGGENVPGPHDDWPVMSTSFLSLSSSGLLASDNSDVESPNVGVTPSETLDSLSSFDSSDGSASVTAGPSAASNAGTPSVTFSPTFSNIPRYPPYPSYRPSVSASSSVAAQDHRSSPGGIMIPSDSVLPRQLPGSSSYLALDPSGSGNSSNTAQFGSRSSDSLDSLGSGSGASSPPLRPQLRPVRRSPSPLVLDPGAPTAAPSPSSNTFDDLVSRYRTGVEEVGPVPRGRLGRREGSTSRESPFPAGEDSQSEQAGSSSSSQTQTRPLDARLRVVRQHSIEREPVRSVFDVFGISDSPQERSSSQRRSPGREEPAAAPVHAQRQSQSPARFASIDDPFFTTNFESRLENRTYPQAQPQVQPQAPPHNNTDARRPTSFHSNLYTGPPSSWASVPSSNSLMSESATERRHALAREQFRASRRGSFGDGDDEGGDGEWSGTGVWMGHGRDAGESGARSPAGLASGAVPLPSRLHTLPFSEESEPGRTGPATQPDLPFPPFLEPFSELFEETERVSREWAESAGGTGGTVSERMNQPERYRWTGVPSSRGAQREQSPRRPSSQQQRPQSQIGATSTTTGPGSGGQYSYSNLNLASFQSGLFRDSLRRNAEVDQPSSTNNRDTPAAPTTHAPVIPHFYPSSITLQESGNDDSGSDMDVDESFAQELRSFVRSRERPHPASTQSATQGQSRPRQPPFSLNMRPGFSILRRSSDSFDTDGRYPYSGRNSTTSERPALEGPRPSIPHLSGPNPPSNEVNDNRSRERAERESQWSARLLGIANRQRDEAAARRNSGSDWHPHPPQHHHHHGRGSAPTWRTLMAERLHGTGNGGNNGSEEEEAESRRMSLGGSIRSRWARLSNSHLSPSTNGAGANGEGQPSSTANSQRSPPHPLGARPQVADYRRASSASIINTEERRVFGRPPQWAINAAAAAEVAGSTGSTAAGQSGRDAPWRSISGPRSSFSSTAAQGGTDATEDQAMGVAAAEETRSRLRSIRQRFQLDRGNGEGIRGFRPGMLRSVMGRRNMGDYVPDELFDSSYEGLLSLSSALGEVRSRATPDEVISSLPTGTFKDWAKEDSETRCPICLDDYEPSDIVTKLLECPHWLHKNCLEQWLRTANTCPVCRKKVKVPSPTPSRKYCPRHRDYGGPSTATNNEAGGSSSGAGRSRPSQSNPATSSTAGTSNDNNPSGAAAMPGNQPSQPPRYVPVGYPVLPSWARRDASPSGRPTRDNDDQSMHGPFITHLRPHHHHVHVHPPHHHLHYHTPDSVPHPAPRPSGGPSNTDAHPLHHLGSLSLLNRRGSDSSMSFEESLTDGRSPMAARRSAFEQLLMPRAPPSEQNTSNESRNSLPGLLFFGMPVPRSARSQASRPEPSGAPNANGAPRNSFAIAPASSVTFTGASTSTSTVSSARHDAPTVVITNSTESPMVVTNRMPTAHPFNTNFNLESTNPQHRIPQASSAQGPVIPATNTLEDAPFGRAARRARYQAPSAPSDSANPPGGSGNGPVYPWWAN